MTTVQDRRIIAHMASHIFAMKHYNVEHTAADIERAVENAIRILDQTDRRLDQLNQVELQLEP